MEGDWTLADVLPASSDWDYNSDVIIYYNGPDKAFEATYLTQSDIDEIAGDNEWMQGQTWVAGWYNATDVGNWGEEGTMRCYNATKIPFGGSGFAIRSSNGVRFAGQVREGKQESRSATFQFVGNCSPVNLTLDKILPANGDWDYNSDVIIYFNGPDKAFEATYLTQSDIDEIVADNEWMQGQTWVAGWYNATDVGNWGEEGTMRCYNSTKIPAGHGFAIRSSNGISIPSAIPDKK